MKFIEVSFINDASTMIKRLLPVDAIACLDIIGDNSNQYKVILKPEYLDIVTSALPNKFSEAYVSAESIKIIN